MPYDHQAPPETEDPRAALGDRSIHVRCAAARDLSRVGTPDDILLLLDRAQNDPSPAVRLGAAGAAADILSRYRVGPRAGELDTATRQSLFDSFQGIDPNINAGLFSLLACIGLPVGFRRIAAGLRDPRVDVRLGAAIGLLRLCQSASVAEDEELEAAVVDLLRDRRLKPDAAAEVAMVAARVGYRSAAPVIASLALEGAHADQVDRALELLRSYEEPLRGAFFTDGRDAGEVNPEPSMPSGFAVFSASGALMGDGDDPANWSYLDGVLPGGIRRMFIRRVGDAEPSAAFQLEGRTWYAATVEQVCDAARTIARPDELQWEALEAESPLEEHAPSLFADLLPDDATGDLLRGLLLARAGRLDAAVEAFDACLQRPRKVPKDAGFYAGQALWAAGRVEDGRRALQGFLQKARKKDPRRAVAEARLR
ncbi:MAG: hypothetical protein D6798_09000 [Deltaproteobacteria bacterium]|nr:MAG: hypothetical protein D6798_09000 [Deltaproteobacteria bacterium]